MPGSRREASKSPRRLLTWGRDGWAVSGGFTSVGIRPTPDSDRAVSMPGGGFGPTAMPQGDETGLPNMVCFLAHAVEDPRVPRVPAKGPIVHSDCVLLFSYDPLICVFLRSGSLMSGSHEEQPSDPARILWTRAIEQYQKDVKHPLTSGPDWKELAGCESTDAIYGVLEKRAQEFKTFRGQGKLLRKVIEPIVHLAATANDVVGEAAGGVGFT